MRNKSKTKQVVSEMDQMAYLMGYDRGKTIFEQQEGHNTLVEARQAITEQKQQLDEVVPLIAGGLVAVQAADWISDWWTDQGDMGGSEKYMKGMSQSTFPEIEKAMTNLGFKAGHDVWDGVDVISSSEARNQAELVDDAIDGWGTKDNQIRSVFLNLGNVLDMARISYEFGVRQGEDMESWVDGDLSTSDINRYIKGPLAKKPFIVYDNVQYDNGADFIAAVEAKIDKDAECEEGFKKDEDGKCVKIEEEAVVVKDVDWTLVTMNGEALDFDYEMDPQTKSIYDKYVAANYLDKYTPEFLFAYSFDKAHQGDGSDYYVEYPGDGKQIAAGGELTEMYGGNKGDESRSERDFDEGGVGRKGGKRVKNVDYGATDTEDDTKDDTKPTKTPSRKTQSANYTLEDIKNGTAVAKKGDKGGVVKQLQNVLMQAGGSLPKYGADGDFGSETVAAVKSFQSKNGNLDNSSGDIGKKTYDAMAGGGGGTKPPVPVKAEEVTKADENEIDKVTVQKEKSDAETIDDQINDLNAQVAKQPTKEKCKSLIASAAAGIKRGVTLNNTDSLAQCYNSYNFGMGGKSRKVRRHYNLKTHKN